MQSIALAGHRRSGTNFATAFIEKNLGLQLNVAGKHKLYKNHRKNLKIIYVFRFPHDTFSSLYDWGRRHWFKGRDVSLAHFLRVGPIEGDGAMANESPISYWRRHVSGWLEHAEEGNVIPVKYEDVQLHGMATLDRLVSELGVTKSKEIQLITEHCGPTGIRVPKRNCYSSFMEYSTDDKNYINNEIGDLIRTHWPNIVL